MKEYGVSEKHEGDEKEKGGEKVKDEKKKKAGGEGALIMAEEREIGGTFHNDSFASFLTSILAVSIKMYWKYFTAAGIGYL